MKRKITLLMLLCALFAFQGFAQSPKMVLVEEGTQASSTFCAEQNPNFDALLDANADKVVILKYQTSWPGFDQMNLDNPLEVQDRVDYYGFSSAPSGMMNGSLIVDDCMSYEGAPECLSQAEIDAANTATSSFDLDVSGAYDSGTLTVTGTLTANEAVSGDLRLRIALTEQTIEYADVPGGTNGETEFYHILKKFVGGSAGIDIADSWAAGDSYTINETMDVSGLAIYRFPELEVVAFVQNDTDKNVFQAAKDTDVSLATPYQNNGIIVKVDLLGETFCIGDQVTVQPEIEIRNGGNDMLTAMDINISVNGSSPQTTSWTGNLGILAKETVSVSASFTAQANNTIELSIMNPNGQMDEDASDNSFTQEIKAPEVDYNFVVLELLTDLFPDETSWQFLDSNGDVVMEAPPGAYTDTATLHIEELYMPSDACYSLVMSDLYGDGLCCSNGMGSYVVKDQSGNILFEGASFGSSESNAVTLNGGTDIMNNVSIVDYSAGEVITCDEAIISPTITVQNLSSNTITSVDIETIGNSESLDTYNWNGSIEALATQAIDLGMISLNESTQLEYNVVGVNGGNDEYDFGNQYGDFVKIIERGYQELTMTLNTDCWPEENTWEVLDGSDAVVMSGGPYDGQGETTITETFSLAADECYKFIFTDSYGDGLFGSQWPTCETNGNISLVDEFGTTLYSYDGTYDLGPVSMSASDEGEFKYNMEVGVEGTIFEESFTVSPNPTSGDIILAFAMETGADAAVSIHDMLGAEVMTLNLGTLASGSHIQNIEMNDLASGVYVVRLIAAGGSVSQKVVLTR